MARRNTGKPSEDEFERRFALKGKAACLFRFHDASDLYGRNRKIMNVPSQPADYLLFDKGQGQLAEVKSTIDPLRFNLNLISMDQWSAAVRVTAAKGLYNFYIHALALPQWFCVPAAVISSFKKAKRASILWPELTDYAWT